MSETGSTQIPEQSTQVQKSLEPGSGTSPQAHPLPPPPPPPPPPAPKPPVPIVKFNQTADLPVDVQIQAPAVVAPQISADAISVEASESFRELLMAYERSKTKPKSKAKAKPKIAPIDASKHRWCDRKSLNKTSDVELHDELKAEIGRFIKGHGKLSHTRSAEMLRRVMEKELFLPEYTSFWSYCKRELRCSEQYIHRLMLSDDIIRALHEVDPKAEIKPRLALYFETLLNYSDKETVQALWLRFKKKFGKKRWPSRKVIVDLIRKEVERKKTEIPEEPVSQESPSKINSSAEQPDIQLPNICCVSKEQPSEKFELAMTRRHLAWIQLFATEFEELDEIQALMFKCLPESKKYIDYITAAVLLDRYMSLYRVVRCLPQATVSSEASHLDWVTEGTSLYNRTTRGSIYYSGLLGWKMAEKGIMPLPSSIVAAEIQAKLFRKQLSNRKSSNSTCSRTDINVDEAIPIWIDIVSSRESGENRKINSYCHWSRLLESTELEEAINMPTLSKIPTQPELNMETTVPAGVESEECHESKPGPAQKYTMVCPPPEVVSESGKVGVSDAAQPQNTKTEPTVQTKPPFSSCLQTGCTPMSEPPTVASPKSGPDLSSTTPQNKTTEGFRISMPGPVQLRLTGNKLQFIIADKDEVMYTMSKEQAIAWTKEIREFKFKDLNGTDLVTMSLPQLDNLVKYVLALSEF